MSCGEEYDEPSRSSATRDGPGRASRRRPSTDNVQQDSKLTPRRRAERGGPGPSAPPAPPSAPPATERAAAAPRELSVEVKPAGTRGNGAFALEVCKAGRWVCNYEGEKLSAAQFEERRSRQPCPEYVFETADLNWAIDGEHSGHWSRFINHDAPWSCNCEVEYETNRPVVRIHAKRDIAIGEELTLDYGDGYWRDRPDKPVLSCADPEAVRQWLQSEVTSWSLAAGIATSCSTSE